jgi:tRNA pseudouridine13 synthase
LAWNFVANSTSQATIDRKSSAVSTKKPDEKPVIIQIPEEDRKALADLLGEPTAQKLVELDETGQAKKGVLPPKERTITFDAITDRTKRGTIHQVCGHLLSPALADKDC